jgi:carboxypeptidase Taq
MSDHSASYNRYQEITQKAADLNYAAAVLGWDQETYMPPKGYAARGRQLATLATQAHAMLTSSEYRDLLQALSGAEGLTDTQAANIRLSLEDFEKASRLPDAFVEELTQATSTSLNAWTNARKANDYSIYAPQLANMIALKRQQADLYGYTGHPYNALLDDYEKGATVALLDGVFAQVGEALLPLLEAIRAKEQVSDVFFNQHFPRDTQWQFSLDVLKAIGYDFDAGRQDYSEHPFTTSFASTDVRVTTRVNEEDLASLLWSSIHEGGHALYEQGLPETQYGMPLGSPASLSIHESQSRLWENCVGRGQSFWKHFYPILQNKFFAQLGNVPLQSFYAGMNKVQPSLIRTEADELTYHFHVMIRYGLEKGLLEGSITAPDLRDAWNESYRKYLGLTPPDDVQGILQDVHWSHGSFGYFPTYSLGSFYAAQFWEEAQRQLPGVVSSVEAGQFDSLLSWLRHNVHQHGRRYRSEELCQRITGRGLDFSSFMRYAQEKYSGIYGVSL